MKYCKFACYSFAMFMLIISFRVAKAQDNDSASTLIYKTYIPLVVTTNDLSYNTIMAQYDLQAVEFVPEGIVPIRVESPNDLAELISDLTLQTSTEQVVEVDAAYLTSPYCQAMSSGLAKLRVHADIDIQGGKIVQRYGVRVVLSGVTYGLSSSNEWGYFTSGNTNKRALWSGGATVHVYILLNTGMTTVYSTPYACSGNFTLP